MLANIGELNYWVCLKHNECTKMGWFCRRVAYNWSRFS